MLTLFNLIFGYSLKDINTLKNKGNVEGIDLIDDVNKIFIQVSSELSTEKINDSLSKKSLKSYTNYHFLFISISKEVTSYFKNNTYNTPNSISFNPQEDIFGINEIAYKINPLPIKELKEIRNYVQDELDFSVDEFKLDSNLTKVVKAYYKAAKAILNLLESSAYNSFFFLKFWVEAYSFKSKINFIFFYDSQLVFYNV